MFRSAAAISAAVFAALLAASAQAEEHLYSYESVSPAARRLAATGLSFQFERQLMGGARVSRVIQTGERGSAALKPAPEGALGGTLTVILAGERPSGDLYEILPEGDGKAFVQAICPGSERAWLLIGPLERFRDLKLEALGRAAGQAAAHKCVALDFAFHSEWLLPPDRNAPRARFPVNKP